MTTGKDQVLSAVREQILPHLGKGVRVQLGLSGGLDSVVLLHALAQLRDEIPFALSAIHVHHGLSPNADAWATFCQNLCAQLVVPCEVVRLTLPACAGKGIERVAREARYAAFADATGDILCLAHHQNDRAETFLLNLFRGAGTLGLAGLPDYRMLGGKRLLRPLIGLPRSALQAWAQARQLHWVEDESNENLEFRRNYVRHKVLPTIANTFPGVVGVLARTSARMAEQSLLLARLAELDGRTCRNTAGYLSVTRLQELPEPAVRNILHNALTRRGIQVPASRRLEQLSAQVMSATAASEAFIRMGAAGVHLWRDQIWIDPAMDWLCPKPYALRPGSVVWPDGVLKIGQSQSVGSVLQVAPVGHGQRFHPVGRCRDRLSELLRAQGVPPWVRPRLPGLWLDDALVWVPHLGWAVNAQMQPGASPAAVFWQEDTSAPL